MNRASKVIVVKRRGKAECFRASEKSEQVQVNKRGEQPIGLFKNKAK